ncbi:hypothetical protein M011DRAFT_473633 [Sporormia fimetaria CBS 119925]|uniref:Rhodopsin domain-containing protein n=1 Tax=Sporormia fimetaria CBS 119925 TaxID=1340428 RepID=A0A6A6VMS2_9PLEO|nr:hypothetical protein M011DRAFT_473633 [Sporormia fimetaria CBS 119925]
MPGRLHEQTQQDSCIGVAIAFTAVSVLIFSLRVYTRTRILSNFGKDDAAMLSALFFTIAYLAALFVARDNGMGFSGATLTLDQMQNLIKATLAIQCMYYVLIFSIKVSILFLYLRFAANQTFARSCIATIHVLTVFTIISILICLLQCLPLRKMWDVTSTIQGHCINTTAFFYFTSSFNILTDIWILVLPIPTLLRIQRPTREKLGLLIVFSLGAFSCIASIVRLHAIRIYTLSKDPFYDSVPINLWSMIEVNIGIWCASIPALKALVSRRQRERSRGGGGYASYASGGRSRGVKEGRMSAIEHTESGTGTVVPQRALGREDVRLGPVGGGGRDRELARKASLGESFYRESSDENVFLPGKFV